MPSFRLIQGLAESHLRRGLSAKEAEEVVQLVMDERWGGEPTLIQRRQLERLALLYGDYFTDAGARRFQDLTGFSIETIAHDGAKLQPGRSAVAIRADAARIDEQFDVEKTGGGGRAVTFHGFDADEVLDRDATEVERPSLDIQRALDLKLHHHIEKLGLALSDSEAVSSVLARVAHIERTKGDNDGNLVPRDLSGADRVVREVMDRVYERSGRRKLSLDTVAERLPAAIFEVVNAGTARSAREEPHLAELYTTVAEDALVALGRGYRTTVIEQGGSHTRFLEDHRINTPTEKKRMEEAFLPLVPPPTVDELSALYEKALAGALASKDFYNATGLDDDALFTLQARLPDAFPRPATIKNNQALAASKTARGDGAKWDLDRLQTLWADQVVGAGKTIEAFARDNDLSVGKLGKVRNKHEDRFPLPPEPDADVRKDAFVAALLRAMEAHPFEKVKGLLKAVNKDPAFRATQDEVTYSQYYSFRRADPDSFPRVDLKERWMVPVAATWREVMAENPGLSRKDMVKEIKKTWPKMTYSRTAHMLEWDPTLPLENRHNRLDDSEIDRLAARILKLMEADRSRSQASIAKQLIDEGADVNEWKVNAIVRQYRPSLFSHLTRVTDRKLLQRRDSLPSRKLLSLCIHTVPPGTPMEEVLARYNKLLEERGLPPYEDKNMAQFPAFLREFGMASPSEEWALTASEIFAEYAAAADEGTTQDEIWDRIGADYPMIDGRDFGRWRGYWKRAPERYPALAPFLRGGKLKLRGLGEPLPEQRYVGGWDFGRVLAHASPAEQRELAQLTEFLHIPLSLPLLDEVATRLNGSRPLNTKNVLWISHLLSDIPAMAEVMKDAGLMPSRVQVVGTPYGSNGAVAEALEGMGLSVSVPELSLEDYRAHVEKALDKMMELHADNGEPVMIMDDGGTAADLLHTKPKYKDFVKNVRLVEQTTGGLIVAEKHALETVVGNVARSKSKKAEGSAIGEVIAAKLVQALSRVGDGVDGQKVTLTGFGFIGPHIAERLKEAGAELTIIERSPEKVKQARELGFQAILDDPADPASQARRADVLGATDILVGATGSTSVSVADLKLLQEGARFASASSKRREADMDGLEAAADSRIRVPSDNPLLALPNYEYEVDGDRLLVIGDGWPINFDGGVQSVPPGKIQLTDAAMLETLFQVCGYTSSEAGLLALAEGTDDELLASYRALEHTLKDVQVYDPDRWRDDLKAIAAG